MKRAEQTSAEEINARSVPVFIRQSLRGLPKSESLHRVKILSELFQNKLRSTQTRETNLERDLLKKKREYESIQFVVNENEKNIQKERDALWNVEAKTNGDVMKTVNENEKERAQEILQNQSDMIKMRNTLSSTARYNEDEINAAMNELKELKATILNNITSQADLLASEQNVAVDNNSEERRREIDYVTQCYEVMKRKHSEEIHALELEIRRITEKPKTKNYDLF